MGVLVGVGSIVLNFTCGSRLLIQCPFEVYDGRNSSSGHGEALDTSPLLFGILNQPITDVRVGPQGETSWAFGAHKGIRVIPDNSGLESYVLSTSKDVFLVSCVKSWRRTCRLTGAAP